MRAGMSELVQMLRGLCNAGVADAVVAGVTYWSDDQLQEILDGTRMTHTRRLMEMLPVYVDGAWLYYEYGFGGLKWVEEAGTESGFSVRDASGATVSGWTANYQARRITFSADQDGAYYYLDCRTYNLYEAAAQVWERKAAYVSAQVDWSSDNHSVKASQRAAHCLKMAAQFRGMAGVTVSRMVRIDEA